MANYSGKGGPGNGSVYVCNLPEGTDENMLAEYFGTIGLLKVMDMEHELRALRTQILEKCIVSVKLQKELAMSKMEAENKSRGCGIFGSETLGSFLQIQPCSENAPQLSSCSIKWYRVSLDGSWNEAISEILPESLVKCIVAIPLN